MKTNQDWIQHFDAWKASGLLQKHYCQLHDIKPASFSSRLAVYRKELQAGSTERMSSSTKALVPVRISASSSADKVILQTRQQHQLQIPLTVTPAWLAEFVRCLG
jgi:hypothetical protein